MLKHVKIFSIFLKGMSLKSRVFYFQPTLPNIRDIKQHNLLLCLSSFGLPTPKNRKCHWLLTPSKFTQKLIYREGTFIDGFFLINYQLWSISDESESKPSSQEPNYRKYRATKQNKLSVTDFWPPLYVDLNFFHTFLKNLNFLKSSYLLNKIC